MFCVYQFSNEAAILTYLLIVPYACQYMNSVEFPAPYMSPDSPFPAWFSSLQQLDLSAAFDTVDRGTLLRRLEKSYGPRGRVVRWFSSYINGRTQSVLCGPGRSTALFLMCGVPQRSVLGPILFSPIHGGSHAVDWTPRTSTTPVCWRHPDPGVCSLPRPPIEEIFFQV